MKKIGIALAWLCVVGQLPALDIMKVTEIQVGMEGIGKTIFKGSKVEEFKFKVLGIWEKNIAPGRNLIWVELVSPELQDSGVIAGMSGSPLYINGRLVGAVAYSLNFAKKPIAGVTPIEDMLQTAEYNNTQSRIDIGNIKVDFSRENVQTIVKAIHSELQRRLTFSPQPDTLVPIRLLSSQRGMHPEATLFFSPALAGPQDLKIVGDSARKGLDQDLFTLAAADAVAIPLVRGDFEYSVSGTVTCVDGKKVFIFGHPFFNLGSIDFPMHRAEVITVIPAYDSSVKLVATRNMVGTALQDRFSAVQGELGRVPYMIPLKVFLKNRNRSFNLEMVNHPLLTPAVCQVALTNIFYAEYQQYGFQSLLVNGKIFIEGEENVVIEDLFSGPSAYDDFANLVLAINYFLLNNKEKNARIQKIDFEVEGVEGLRRADLENVLLDKTAYMPGEPIQIRLLLRNEKGGQFEDRLTLQAPNLQPGSVFYILSASAQELLDFDTKAIKTDFFPVTLNALIRAINNLRHNNRVYFKMFISAGGAFIRGYEYAQLPQSLSNVFYFNSLSKDQSPMTISTIAEYQYEIPAVVSGKKIFKLRIKERKNDS